jgi:hypothetical protein
VARQGQPEAQQGQVVPRASLVAPGEPVWQVVPVVRLLLVAQGAQGAQERRVSATE